MALGYTVASDIADAVLDWYVRGETLAQTIQDKPLLKKMMSKAETFAGGKANVSVPVQGAYMGANGAQTTMQEYSGATALTFDNAEHIERAVEPWVELHTGLQITWTELKQDGITISDSPGGEGSSKSGRDKVVLTGIMKNRMADWTESWARAMNAMLYGDGTKGTLGLAALIPNVPGATALHGIDGGTLTWWKNRASLTLAHTTPSLLTIVQTLRDEIIQLRRFSGKPDCAFCGSEFWTALQKEVQTQGYLTQTGFAKNTDVDISGVNIDGLNIQYDPTLDDLSKADYCYVLDSRRVKLWGMDGEVNRIIKPTRPYDQLVFLRSMTWTGAMMNSQPNACAVYKLAT